MSPDVRQWVGISDYDFQTAQAMFRSRRYLYVLFCCQQALEKRLKALVTKVTKSFPPKTHDLLRLTGLAKVDLKESQELFLRRLNNYYIETRYPEEIQSLARAVDRRVAHEYLNTSKEFAKWLDGLLK